MATPEQALEAIHRRFGAHDGHRALHAKGVVCRGTFTAARGARALTRAAHMAGAPVRATVRFSNGGGDPTVPDHVPDVRGLAVSFHLPDGSRTDILAQTVPFFPFRTHEGFLAALAISKPSLAGVFRLPVFAIRHPRALTRLPQANRVMGDMRSLAARRYYPFHAYKWIDADGGERFVRYRWLPTVEEPGPARSEAKAAGPDFLFDELRERLEREPVRMELEVQIAGPGDDPDDPSAEWPDERERVVVGTLEIDSIDPDADDSIVFDPMRVTDGIEPSGDEVLGYRPAVYSLSHARRTAV